MKFGPVAVGEAAGAILAHSLQLGGRVLKKGRVLTADDVERLREAGYAEIVVARLDSGDVAEDTAAARVAAAIVPDAAAAGVRIAEAFTGRVNLFAIHDGVLALNRSLLTSLNRIDEGLTIATLAERSAVKAGQMVATVKIIPFALPETCLANAEALARDETGLCRVVPLVKHSAGLILTELAGSKPSVLEKRQRAIADRVVALGSELVASETVPHDTAKLAAALKAQAARGIDPILVFGASAIIDRADVVPAAVAAAGGEVLRLGIPVDPGNLLLLGRIGTARVVGVPSCASSPKENGFDWVLRSLLTGATPSSEELADLGHGGLLMEIGTRPQPREAREQALQRSEPRIAALILAAGRSTRMGASNKLAETLQGKAVLRHVADAAIASRARPIVVVTGHQRERVEALLTGLEVTFVHNPDFATGLSSSLAAGLAALPPDMDGAVVLLGDMPEVRARHIDRLIAAFAPKEGRSICVPVRDGRRGNPVLWGREHFAAMIAVKGDTGARHLIGDNSEAVIEVDLGSNAIFTDVDTPEALAELRERRKDRKER